MSDVATDEKQATAPLRCQFCDKAYTELDVKLMNFFPETMGCWNCYVELFQSPISRSCFGKKTQYDGRGKPKPQHVAYDAQAVECRFDIGICPHRFICPKFISGEIFQDRLALKEAYPVIPFRQKDSIIAKAFKACLRGTTKGSLFKLILQEGGSAEHVLRTLRKGEANGRQWLWDEVDDHYKIYFEIYGDYQAN